MRTHCDQASRRHTHRLALLMVRRSCSSIPPWSAVSCTRVQPPCRQTDSLFSFVLICTCTCASECAHITATQPKTIHVVLTKRGVVCDTLQTFQRGLRAAWLTTYSKTLSVHGHGLAHEVAGHTMSSSTASPRRAVAFALSASYSTSYCCYAHAHVHG